MNNMKKWFNCCVSGVKINEKDYDVASIIEIVSAEDANDAKAQIREMFCRQFPDIRIDNVIVDSIKMSHIININEGECVGTTTIISTEQTL